MNWPAAQWETWTHPNKYALGNRHRQVNFTWAVRNDEFPYTIEFRQARGTLDARDISRWVDFCIALIKLAEDYTEGESNSGARKRFQPLDWDVSIFDLIEEMELGDEALTYWRGRVVKFMGYSFGDEDDRLDNEDPGKPFEDVKDLPPRRYEVKKRPYPFSEETIPASTSKRAKKPPAWPDSERTSPPPAWPEFRENKLSSSVARFRDNKPPSRDSSYSRLNTSLKGMVWYGATMMAVKATLYKKAVASYLNFKPEQLMKCPAGLMAKEAMTRVDGGTAWQVEGYNSSEWIMEKTRPTVKDPVSGIKYRGLCGLTGLVQSIKAQYPDSIYGKDPNLKPGSLISTLIEVLGTTEISNNQSPDDIDKMLNRLTDGKFALVTVPVDFNGTGRTIDDVTKPGGRAVRTTVDFSSMSSADGIMRRGNNLYMHFKANAKTGQGHWQSMKRKK